jgi:exopolysaccharide production protein ExoQ
MTQYRRQRRKPENGAVRNFALGILGLIVIVSTETFNPVLLGSSDENLIQQGSEIRAQLAAIALFLLLMGLSFLPAFSRHRPPTRRLMWPALFLMWIVISPLWSSDPVSGAPKAVVFLAFSLAAWRMAAFVTVEEMFACVFYSLSALLFLSVILVAFFPSVGILVQDWQHEGQWKGAFGTKQGLGAVSAVFLVISLLRLSRRRTLFDAAACAVGFACLLGSESRGAGAVAIIAVGCLLAARVRPHVTTIIIGVLLVGLTLGFLEIIYFAATENSSIQILGSDINLTERTYIWQYALTLWNSSPFLGYGLNGFWTNRDILSGFLRLHGWVLDNYHSGYVAIAVETGGIGLLLFLIVFCQVVAKLRYLLIHTVSDRLGLEMTLGFVIMLSTINLSETYYLRSTNFFSVLFTFLIIKILSTPTVSEIRLARQGPRFSWKEPARLAPAHATALRALQLSRMRTAGASRAPV